MYDYTSEFSMKNYGIHKKNWTFDTTNQWKNEYLAKYIDLKELSLTHFQFAFVS